MSGVSPARGDKQPVPWVKKGEQTHCLRGHEFDEANTALVNGHRICKKCKAWRRSKARQLTHPEPLRRPASGGRVCSVDACESEVEARGLCEMHYNRIRVNGSPDRQTPEEYFWSRVDKTDECWLWTGPKQSGGYGRNAAVIVHRYVYEMLVGPIPDGLHLDHLCRVRHCCNPEHLEPVTPAENSRRAVEARRVAEQLVRLT